MSGDRISRQHSPGLAKGMTLFLVVLSGLSLAVVPLACGDSRHQATPTPTPESIVASSERTESLAREKEVSAHLRDAGIHASTPQPHPGGDAAQSVASYIHEARDVSAFSVFQPAHGGAAFSPPETLSIEAVLNKGLNGLDLSPTHIVFRGTVGADSIRCEWRGVARAMTQREEAIRFWLELEDDDPLPLASEVETRFVTILDAIRPAFPETAEANFRALARGGLSVEFVFLTCFSDFSVVEYLVGSGPSSITVSYDQLAEARAYALYKDAHAAGEFGPATSTPLMSEGEYQAHLDRIVSEAESTLIGILADHEAVVFLAPMGAHNTIAVEAWQAVEQWDLQTDDDNTVHAVRYGTSEGDPEHTQTLTNLKSRITAATTATSTTATSTAATTTRIASVSGLTQYYRDIGAYSDITPGDNATTTFTPAQPPPVYAPAPASLSATGSGENTANLSWSAVNGASGYHVQRRPGGEDRWTTAVDERDEHDPIRDRTAVRQDAPVQGRGVRRRDHLQRESGALGTGHDDPGRLHSPSASIHGGLVLVRDRCRVARRKPRWERCRQSTRTTTPSPTPSPPATGPGGSG